MHRHDKVEAILNTLKEDLAVIDINIELSLEGIMNEDASLDVDVVVLGVPVCLESHWYTIPTLGVNVTETITHAFYDALCQDSGLYRI